MIDYISLSQTTPWGEECAQLGSDNYISNSRLEADTYTAQLMRTFGRNPIGSYFKYVKCPHDFGTYLDIRFYYNEEDQQHVQYMCYVDEGMEFWDEEAKEILTKENYSLQTIRKRGH